MNARELAFLVLDEYHRTSTFTARLLRQHDQPGEADADGRRLAMEIVYGVVRRQATLNAMIVPCVSRPRHRVEAGLWTLLQIGAYQLLFLDSVPDHAAVQTTVDVAKRRGHPRWTGFLNAALRSIAKSVTAVDVTEPAVDTVPISPGRYRRLTRPVFPEPSTDPCGFIAGAFSYPRWLVERWQQRYDLAELIRLGFWFNAPTGTCLRVNRLRTDRTAVLDTLQLAGFAVRAGSDPDAVWLDRAPAIEQLPGFDTGRVTVQDESAMQAARLLAPQPGETVLDLCAAPGGKTTHMAELMGDRGRIIACDVNAQRLDRVTESAQRLGIGIIEPRVIHHDGRDVPSGPFDAVLLDVPCSNTGVLGKRPEVRWRIGESDIRELAAQGGRLFASVADRLKPGGRLVYSTCSLEPEENAEVVRTALAEHPWLRLDREIHHRPGCPADGGYQALCLVNGAHDAVK